MGGGSRGDSWTVDLMEVGLDVRSFGRKDNGLDAGSRDDRVRPEGQWSWTMGQEAMVSTLGLQARDTGLDGRFDVLTEGKLMRRHVSRNCSYIKVSRWEQEH